MTKEIKQEKKEKPIKKTIAYGVLELLGNKIPCAVLEGEIRVLVQRQVVGLLTGNKKGGFDRYFQPKNLKPYLPEKFKNKSLDQVTHTFYMGGNIAQGFEAEDIIEICDMYIRADNAGILIHGQKRLAKHAAILMKSYAKIGLVALIDEATGFQKKRPADALRILVESYIIKEARKWTKEFPDEFFAGLDYIYENQPTISRDRPRYYGIFINKHIYKPIENGLVYKRLDKINPLDDKGNRRKRLHQFLSKEIGLKTLHDRISKIIGVMQVSPNKRRFDENYERLESKQTWFDFDIKDEDKNISGGI